MRLGELEVVEVAEHDDVRPVVQRQNVWRRSRARWPPAAWRCASVDAVRRLEAAEQRLVAALGVEVVGDHEQAVAVVRELAGQRLAAGVEGRVGRIDAARAGAELRASRAGDDASPAWSSRRPGRSTKLRPRSVRNRKPTRMLPPGSPPSWLLTGLIWRNSYVGPPAAWMAVDQLGEGLRWRRRCRRWSRRCCPALLRARACRALSCC